MQMQLLSLSVALLAALGAEAFPAAKGDGTVSTLALGVRICHD